MSIHTVTHINFQGQARAALSFYHTIFGGQQTLVTYAEAVTFSSWPMRRMPSTPSA